MSRKVICKNCGHEQIVEVVAKSKVVRGRIVTRYQVVNATLKTVLPLLAFATTGDFVY